MKRLSLVAIFALAIVLLAPQAQAVCPAGITSPLQALSGQYAYKAEGFSPDAIGNFTVAPPPNLSPAGYVGIFTPSIGTVRNSAVPNGILSIVQTVSRAGKIIRLENTTGQYQIFPDCSGGVLFFYSGQDGVEFDFWFFNSFAGIYMIVNDTGWELTGVASKV